MTVSDCTIAGNSVTTNGYGGGGILNFGTATVTGYTITNNTGPGITNAVCHPDSHRLRDHRQLGGGGIVSYLSTVTVIDCTIANNRP